MFESKKIFILGMARSGYEAAKLLSNYNNEILVTDMKEQDENLVKELESLNVKIVITDTPVELLDDTYDYVIKNPGIRYDHPVVLKANELNIKVINEVEMSYSFIDKDVNIIGITGSNGKTTTSNLIYEILKEEKDEVILGGNVGVPLSHFARDIKKGTYLVLEISDHQLCDMYDFKTNVSVLTNITPTHLDFHPSYEVYKSKKKKIFNNHTSSNYAIINSNDKESLNVTSDIKSTKIYYGNSNNNKCYCNDEGIYYDNKLIIKLSDILLKGKHNYENIMAAICACKIYNVSNESIINVLKKFKGVEHRLEYVCEYNGIKFYNDSKATNCVSTNIALASFNEPTILLLGGTDRGHSFYDLKDNMKNVKCVMCYGESKDRIEDFCKDLNIECYKFDTLKESMKKVSDVMGRGDVVLLSPACASWDQYKDFEVRGKEFKDLVKEITNE
ncbi:MAG: UDP-N-acetylmuramoyl-L-alanine--D-glutamate ligase [Firmicutes bacterium]|nr:UDP-N-acetylmuramoyl-L-alanine--D-glutamate ligase [Bacillota bacterium]